MPIVTARPIYPFAELIRVTTEGTTPVDLYPIPPGTVIESVTLRVVTPGVGAHNVTVGDNSSANGFLTAFSGLSAADTFAGNTVTERGAYLYDATHKAGYLRAYMAAGSAVRIVCSANPTSNGTFDVLIVGKRFNP